GAGLRGKESAGGYCGRCVDAPNASTRTYLGVATDARYLAFSACSRRRLLNGVLPGKAGRPIGLSFRQSEQFPQGLQQRVPVRMLVRLRLLGQGADRAAQYPVLEQPERPLDLRPVGLAQPAVEALEQLPQDRLPLALQLLRQPGDHRAVPPPRPILEEL